MPIIYTAQAMDIVYKNEYFIEFYAVEFNIKLKSYIVNFVFWEVSSLDSE